MKIHELILFYWKLLVLGIWLWNAGCNWIFVTTQLRNRWMLGKAEGRRRGATEDKMVGWHHWHNGHEFEQTPGDSEGQGSLACCSPLGYEKLDTTERLNNNNKGTDGAAAHQHSMKMCLKSVPSSAGWAAGAVNTTVKTEVPAQSKISRRYFHFSYSDKLCYAITHFIIIF